MNAPDKCPKCGARTMDSGQDFVRWACMSYSYKAEPVRESERCLGSQRDQLADEVDRLRKDEWMPAACLHLMAQHGVQIGSPQLLEAKGRVEADAGAMRKANAELEQRVKELEAKSELNATRELELEAALARVKGWKAERDQLAARVKKLEAWIADLDEIGRHSSTSEHREWNGEIGWLLKGQVAYVGDVKP